MTLQELREQINKLGSDISAILAAAPPTGLSDDDKRKFDAMDADRDKLLDNEKRVAKHEEIEARLAGSSRRTEPVQPRTEPVISRASNVRQFDAETFRAFFLPSEQRTDKHVDLLRRAGIDPTSKGVNLRLAVRPPASHRPEDIREWQQRHIGVDVSSPDDGGHYLVPDETMTALEVALLAFSPIRQVATVIRTDSGAALPMPTMNDTSNKGQLLAESVEETTETYPTLNQLVLESFTYSAKKLLVSLEFMQDNAINFAARVGEILGERIARITNDDFTTGDGSSKPKGITIGAATSSVTTAAAGSISYDDIIDLKHSVDPAYRVGARFMFGDSALKILKKLKVAQYSGDTGGYPLWRPGMALGEPDTLDGDPYVINSSMPAATGAGNRAIVYGNLSKYIIRDVRMVEVLRLNELRAMWRQVVWTAFSRHDGDLLDAGTYPVKYLTMGS